MYVCHVLRWDVVRVCVHESVCDVLRFDVRGEPPRENVQCVCVCAVCVFVLCVCTGLPEYVG
jgi:hypothetical protein